MHRQGIRKRKEGNQWKDDVEPDLIEPPIIQEDIQREDFDSKEVEKINARLLEKDLKRTKRVVEDHSSKEAETSTHGLSQLLNDPKARKEYVSQLRERSRQNYLNPREAQILELSRQRIETEAIFGDLALTEAEMKRTEIEKSIYNLAAERRNIDLKPQLYQMPENYFDEEGRLDTEKREQALTKTYKESVDQRQVSEQTLWEETQIQKLGETSRLETKNEYDFVLDEEEIGFVAGAALEGENNDSEALKPIDIEALKQRSIIETRQNLPIFAYRDELINAIRNHQVLIIVGETGSGKTTQIPQYLHEAGFTKGGKKIGCTQPRRVAAMSVAARVSEEMRTRIGYEIGYSIRFEDCTSEKTVIKYMTDGMLLREFLTEPDLSSYNVLIIDEAHERTLHTDILFGLVKDISRYRPDLKLLVSSATLDAEKFSDFFDGAPVFTIPGRRFPVDMFYTKVPEADYLAAAISTIMQIHLTQPVGDILVFLSGQEEIETVQENLQLISKNIGSKMMELIIAPIYSTLPSELQGKIFKPTPPGARKVVLATNIAETSITIDGIVYVIDPGFSKVKNFNPRTGMESLMVTPCSKASANQRAGRAGRVGPGKCFRLYTLWAFQNEMDDNITPEIQRTNLANVVLLLKSLGINDLLNFDFMDKPSEEVLIKSLEQLYALGALNDHGELTKTGRRMAEFPLDPMMSKSILASEKFGCSEEVASIIAMLSIQSSLFFRPKEKRTQADAILKALARPFGDHLTLLNIWNSWVESNFDNNWCYDNFIQARSMKRVRDVRDQLIGLMNRVEIALESKSDDHVAIRKALLAGYFFNAARLQRTRDSYNSLKHGQTIYIHPSSTLFGQTPNWVIYHELVLTSKEYMRQVMEILPEWLVEAAPHYYSKFEIDNLDGNTAYKLPISRGKLPSS